MASRSFRSDELPNKIILLTDSTETIPTFSTYNCADTKVIKSPSCGVNPGTNVGSSTHQHPVFVHDHPDQDCVVHTHPGKTGNASSLGGGGNQNLSSSFNHGHCFITNDGTANFSPANDTGHQHAGLSNDALTRTFRALQKDPCLISMRKKQIPHNSYIFWFGTHATRPPGFSHSTQLDCNRHVKICNASTLTAAGNATHQHDSVSTHTHVVTISCHDHCSGTSSFSSSGDFINGFMGSGRSRNHSHCPGNPNWTPNSGTPPSDSGGAHCHDATNNDLAFEDTSLIKVSSIGLRRTGIPLNGQVLWDCTLASIPANFTQNTTILDKYPRGVTNICTEPASTGGSNTHTHADDGGHEHTSVATAHLHDSNAAVTGCGGTSGGGGSGSHALVPHNHTYQGTFDHTTLPNLTIGPSAHTETSTDLKPESREVAFIRRL